MICPFCGTQDTRVIDSRLDTSTNQVRRRRECCECKQRYTTYEVAFLDLPSVVKSAGYSSHFQKISLEGVGKRLRSVQSVVLKSMRLSLKLLIL